MFDGERFSFPSSRWWEPGGGAGGLTCGLRVETASHLSQRATIIYPAEELPGQAVAKSLNQLRQSHWATGQAGQG